MPTVRALRDDIANAFDFFTQTELVLFAATVSVSPTRVSWQAPSSSPFVIGAKHATVEEYLTWVRAGQYSAVLPDASLLQLTYDIQGGEVVRHRLAYVPCPVLVDEALLREEAILDVVALYLSDELQDSLALRSPVRFDFDLQAAKALHPAAHVTINSADCRIACVAPIHPYRFLDLVYKHFYPELWIAQSRWFRSAAERHLGERVLTDSDAATVHVTWPLHRIV